MQYRKTAKLFQDRASYITFLLAALAIPGCQYKRLDLETLWRFPGVRLPWTHFPQRMPLKRLKNQEEGNKGLGYGISLRESYSP